MKANAEQEGDPFDLQRYVDAQADVFDRALAELRAGSKESHWMWFIFPQLAGLGHSPTARRYALRDLDEARAYLQHAVLGPRLLECCRCLLAIRAKSATEILGYPDDLKLNSSMTLFSLVDGAPAEFGRVIAQYYSGQPDTRTLELLRNRS